MQDEAVLAIYSDVDDLYVVTFANGILNIEDGGMTWQNIGLSDKSIHALHTIDDELYVGLINNGYEPGPYDRSNYGEDVYIEYEETSDGFYAIIHDGDREIVELIEKKIGGGLYKYNGSSWEDISSELTDRDVFSLCSIDGVLYVGTNKGGVFRRANDGFGWVEVDVGLADEEGVILLYVVGNDLYAATDGGGVLKSVEQ